jgi:hypothetical protein
MIRAAIWMIVISVLLFWLPVAGPLIAGIIGGRMAGGPGRAVMAALLPALALAVLAFIISAIFSLPVVGAVAGFGLIVAAVVGSVPLLVGAFIGGIL